MLVAVADPTNVVASDDLRLALGMNVRIAVAAATELFATIERLYGDNARHRRGRRAGARRDSRTSTAPRRARRRSTLVNSLISRAIDERASDLHFEPQAKQMLVRARVDGVMRRFTTIPEVACSPP